jgi:DNA-binding NarL/FixJ family response regulator
VDKGFSVQEPATHRVLIADDSSDLRLLLRTRLGLEHDIEVVGEASDGAEAVRLTKALSPSGVVLDLDMPVMSGDQAIPLLREAAPEVGILLYTGVHAPELAEDSKPDGILHKGASVAEVVTQLRAILNRETLEAMPTGFGSTLAETARDNDGRHVDRFNRDEISEATLSTDSNEWNTRAQ